MNVKNEDSFPYRMKTNEIPQMKIERMHSACWRRMVAVMLLALGGSALNVAWATDYIHVMLGAADGSGRRPVTAKFVRTDRNSNGQLEPSQLSPIVNKHRYFSTATDNGDGTFTVDESSEITSGNHFASDEVVVCYVTYDDYDRSLFTSDKPFRITLGDASVTTSFSDKYWTATTSGIFSTSDGTYTNADLWTITGDPYSMQFHPYSQSTQSLTLGNAGSTAYDTSQLLSGTAFQLLPTATSYAYNQFYLTTFSSLATIRVNSSIDGTPIQNSEADGLHAGPIWYSSGTQLKAYRERKYSGIYFAKSDPSDNTRRFHILNSSGVQEALWEPGATFNDLSLRRFFQSPFCSNYRYSSTSDMTGALPTQNSFGWLMDVVTDIYVRYDYDPTIFSGTRAYRLRLKTRSPNIYVGSPTGEGKLSQVTSAASASFWKISGTPYAFRITSADDASRFITSPSLAGNQEVYLSNTSMGYDTYSATFSHDSKATFSIYINPGAAVSVQASSRSAVGSPSNNTSYPVRVENQPYSSIKGWSDWSAVFEGDTQITYHVVNLNGDEVVSATDYLFDGESLRVPDVIRSPLATGWTFYGTLSDAQSKTNAIVSAGSLSDIYARYEYDNATSPVDLSGKTWYLMQFADQDGRYIYKYDNTNHYVGANVTMLKSGATAVDYEQFDRFYWTFTGGDPYGVSVVNKREPSLLMGKPSTSTGLEQCRLAADGTSGYIQQFALMQNPGKRGLYELMGVHDSGTTGLYYYFQYDGSQGKMRAHADYQSGNINLQLQLTPYRCYHIVNNDGEEAIQRMAPATTTLAVPDIIKSPLMTASQYRYYGSLADATYNSGAGQNALDASNTPAHTHGDIYVRYDYDNATSPLDLNGATKYTWVMPSGGSTRFHYANSNVANRTYINNSAQANATIAHGDRYRWALSGNDPYRITFLNSAYDERVLATNPSNLNHNTTQELFMRLPADVTGLGTQHFLLTQGSGLSTYQILLADGRNHPTNHQDWDDLYYYLRNNNGDYSFFRADDRTLTDGAERTQHAFYHEPLYYAVVNTLGEIAIDGYYLNRTATLEMMSELKTPYLPNDASYKFFRTQADAAAYSNGTSDGSAAITLVSETDGTSVYIGYRYDDAARPSGLPSLQGALRYYMRGYKSPTNSTDSYYYYTQNLSVNPSGGHGSGKQTRILSSNNLNLSDGQWSLDLFHWTFSGNDPYAISVNNVFTGKTANAHEGSYQLHASGTNNWGWDLDLDGTRPQRMVMLSDGGSRYLLAILSPYYGVENGKHVEYWSRDGSNGFAQITRNDQSNSYAYATYTFTSERYGSLAFEAADPVYVIVNNEGRETFRWIDNQSGNTVLRVLDGSYGVASPLASNYRFYTSLTDAQTDASTSGESRPNALEAGTAAVKGTTYYVRYSLAASPSFKLNGTRYYIIQTNGGTLTMRYLSGASPTAKVYSSALADDTEYWTFNGGDPYDVRLANVVNISQNDNTYRLTANNVLANTGNLSSSKDYNPLAFASTGDVDLSGGTTLQSFFFTQYPGKETWQLIGAYNGFLYKPGDPGHNHGGQRFYLAGSSDNTNARILRQWTNENGSSNYGQLVISPLIVKTYHLITRNGTELPAVTVPVSIEDPSASIVIPAQFERKYISSYGFYTGYDGTQENYNDRFTGPVTTVQDLIDADGDDIYIKYTVGTLPFDISTDYDHARWYRMTAQGAAYTHLSGSSFVAGTDGVYDHDYQYAFFGDPYELKIMNREAGDGKYLGVPTGSSLATNISPQTAGNVVTWEILPESADGTFQLRAFGTAADPRYAGYASSAAQYISTSAMTLAAVPLPTASYIYHIIDNTGREAINATVTQDIYTPISYDNLPATIRSPYIADETITGYLTRSTLGTSDGRTTYSLSNAITETPTTDADIYIRYTTENLAGKTLKIDGKRSYNVVQVSSSKYAYKDGDTTIGYNDDPTTANKQSKEYLWSMTGSDPYAVTLQNVRTETYYTITTASNSYVPTFSLGALGYTSTTDGSVTTTSNTFFIIMGGTTDPSDLTQVQLKAATGTSSTGGEELRFESNLPPAHYYVIDRQHKVIVDAVAPSSDADLYLPDAIRSPLVSTYHYWKFQSFSANSDGTGDINPTNPDATYYVKSGEAEITSLAEALGGGDIHIYCTYGTEDLVNPDMFAKVKTTTSGSTTTYSHVMARDESKDAPTYMIKYLSGDSFNQENESDGFLSEKSPAMYPYNNGDGALYVYGEQQWKNQLAKAATTRGRWLWFIESETLDPYHVYVGSRQGNRSHFSYLRTYQPVDYDQIITNVITGNTADVADGSDDSKAARHAATEYMILGTPGHGRFVTVGTVALDKNHDGDTTDEGESTERRTVTSFEQYWKNQATAQPLLKAAGQAVTTEGRNVVTSAEQKAILEKGQDGDGEQTWHAYNFWANAHPWVKNSNGSTGRQFGYEEHWFQTINMGTGEFTLEEVSLTSTLILLDQHGWEIMRTNLPNGPTDPYKAQYYENIRRYHSPMVARYHYWKSGSKQPGYHKFTVSDYAVDASGSEYTTEVLGLYDSDAGAGNLPDWVTNGSLNRDWYVTYDVKEEYADAYQGAATEGATQASAYMVKQDSKWLTTVSNTSLGTTTTTPATYSAITDNMLFYLRPNFNIDREMGYLYLGETGAKDEAESRTDTDNQNYSEGRNGFDPYNVQLQSKVYTDRYVTTDATTATLNAEGGWTGTYTSGTLSLKERAKQIASVTGHDQASLNITNATFMVVDDGNGNMRLMPRFDHSRVVTSLASVSGELAAAPANDATGTQTLLLAHPMEVTYHVVNKNSREAVTYKKAYYGTGIFVPSAHFPAYLQAYGAQNFRYYPLSEFDPEAYARNVYQLVSAKTAQSLSAYTVCGNQGDLYVMYDVDADKMTTKGFDGKKMFNLKLQNTTSEARYLNYDTSGGTVSASATSLTADEKKTLENIWRIETSGGDPYQAQLYNFRNSDNPLGVSTYGSAPTAEGTETYTTFIITDWDYANNKFELLAANSRASSGSSDNYYAYLTYSDGPKVLQSESRQHNATVASNLVGFTLEPVTLSFTYKLYDLAGNLTLQGGVTDVSDITPSLPEFMRSPLVADEDYSYWQDDARSTPLTTLSASVDNAVYVSYVPLAPKEVALKLDGSQTYTFHTKLNTSTLAMGESGRVSLRTKIGKRPNYYELTLHGREINGQYDPYDVAVFSPFQNRYWQSGNVNNTSANRQDDLSCNSQTVNSRFMILRGTTHENIDYIQIAQKRQNGSTYYPALTGTLKYVYHDGTNFSTGQGTTSSIAHTDGEEHQLHVFQPARVYHVLNLQGREAVAGIEARLVKPDDTAPLLPTVIQSPVVKNYHYYDISAFNISADGTYVLKSNAQELEYVSRATTNDIYVLYTHADLDKSYHLDGGLAYNIIFGPDAFTQDGITETLNSYFGYDAGITYRNATSDTNAETFKFQVTGSYYADPSSGAMASRYIVVNSDGEKGTDSGSDATRWNPKYLVEPALTDEQKEGDHYLWSFTGDDPYALKLHNMTAPDKYVYRNSDAGGYTVGLTLGTTANEQRSTYMLVGRGSGDDTRFNLMASGSCTAGIAPYSYQYIGRSYHSNVHRTTRRGVVLQGFNDWGWSYIYDEALVTVKVVPQKLGYVTYVVKDKSGKEAIHYKTECTLGIPPEIPAAIRSPYAKNFQYWSDAGCTSGCTATSANATIYVTYETDTEALAAADLDLTGSATENNSYNIQVNGVYLYYNVSDHTLTADASPSRYDDTMHEWYLEGDNGSGIDPYDVRLRSKQNTARYIELAAYDNTREWTALSPIADAAANQVRSFILMDGQPGRMELLAATGSLTNAATTDSEIKNRLAYLGFNGSPQLLGVGTDDAHPAFESGKNQVQVILRQPYTGVTYHIMNLNGLEAVCYTVEAAKGDDLEVPAAIRSPFATNWQFWSDAACTSPLEEVPDAHADIYVTYTYDDDTRDQLLLDGTRFYNMQVADRYIHEEDGSIVALDNETLTTEEANLTANLWTLDGTTASKGIDPYNLHLLNKAYDDIYAGASLSYVSDTETTVQMSDGETENFRSTFFLVGSSADGPYELVLASGQNITDDVLAYVNRHDDEVVNLNREAAYKHGDDALQIQFSSPVNQYLYKVYDRSGNLAIQAWGDGVAGAAPEIPAVIKSPLVSTFYYNVETLPYTTGVDEVEVRYDFDKDKLTSPNLLGKKLYNLKFRNNYFIKADGSAVALESVDATNKTEGGTLSESTDDIYIWKPTGQYGGDGVEDIDPYCITLKHSNGNVLTASTISLGDENTLTLETDGTANTYQRFILLPGTDGRYEFMAATGDAIGSTYGAVGYDMFAYLAITDDNLPKLARGEAYSRGKTAVQVEMVPFQYDYTYIIVNNDGYEALRGTATQEGGDAPYLIDGLRSPLINDNEYVYYTAGAFSQLGSWHDVADDDNDNRYVLNDATKDAYTLDNTRTLPYSNTTIYVRYTYTPKVGGLDIGTSSERPVVKYHIGSDDLGTFYYMRKHSTATNYVIESSSTNSTSDNYAWLLDASGDPYDVILRNAVTGLTDEGRQLTHTNLYRASLNGNGHYTWNTNAGSNIYLWEGNHTETFFANRYAILKHPDGDYRVMLITPWLWDETWMTASVATYSTSQGYNSNATGDFNFTNNAERYITLNIISGQAWKSGSYQKTEPTGGTQIQFIPTTTHNYRFHLTTKIDGRQLVVEKRDIMARDIFSLPEELKRKYCDYTYTYYTDTDDESTRLPITKETAEASGREAIAIGPDALGITYYPFFQAIDNMSESDRENTWVDIYIDYHAHQHYKTDADGNYVKNAENEYEIDPDGMPFNVMAWNAATVHNLLNNEAYTDYLFQINNYENLTETLAGTTFGLQRKDYLYFMVLKTNNDYSNSNGQYFLRREDNGRVSWLNNDYKLYRDNAKNYKQWGYSRCAEAYRDNDHSVFEEKKWLFCFAGDPYDFYIFNANSVVEETYNTITEQKEFVRTHRDHLVSYATLTSTSGTTTEYAVNTPSYTDLAPQAYRWGLAMGQGANSDETFSLVTSRFTPTANEGEYKNPTLPNIDEKPLYWRMDMSAVDNRNEVMLQTRATDNTTLDYNIQVLPYEPTRFEDMRFVIRRDDDVAEYRTFITTAPGSGYSPERQRSHIEAQTTGGVFSYNASSDRAYAAGDRIGKDDLPLELQRKFCDYTFYTDDYQTAFTSSGDGSYYTVIHGPIRGAQQRYGDAARGGENDPAVVANPALNGMLVYNTDGSPIYYYHNQKKDGEGNYLYNADGTPQLEDASVMPQTIYVEYKVTTDKFLKQHPTRAQVEELVENNDHVYFMDFADPNLLKGGELGYNTGHHAYLDETATFRDQIGTLHENVLAEKMKWNGIEFVYDTEKLFNDCQYKTTSNRMESVPENLKWYFVGDPYKLQVYCTEYVLQNDAPEANLCRFDPTESNFQFVVDCVHLRTPDPSIIDERETLTYTDSDGNEQQVANENYGKPYYDNFYWDVVPAMSEDDDDFALRFRDDNQLLGYRSVYYYLAHDGIKRTYREALSENPKAYGINLSYDESNAIRQSGKYKGYHTSNDENCVIRLRQPAKVYFTAYKETYGGEPVVKEELSEYYGVGETLTEVPRHLQRKYVKYGNLQYQAGGSSTWNDGSFGFTLSKDKAFNLEDCNVTAPVHTVDNGWVFKETDSSGDNTKCRASYKCRVTYEVDDETAEGIHLFTTPAQFANASVTPQWLDVKIGNSKWIYYDKTNVDSETGNENQTSLTTSYPVSNNSTEVPDGWDTGIKGLHWAFVGDPYKFTIVNRRRWEDQGSPRTGIGDDLWLGTGYAQMTEKGQDVWYNYTQLGDTNENRDYGRNGTGGNDANGNTNWSLMMCKTGASGDYFIRTTSPKTSSVSDIVGDYANSSPSNMTNDYARITNKAFSSTDSPAKTSSFVLETFSLDTKTRDIQKADIRTVTAEDNDGADNDCFDATVRVYNLDGELKATLKHVEVTYGDVVGKMPKSLKRYGCNYIECYQISYPGYTPTMVANPTASETTARTAAIATAVSSLNNFTGENKIGSIATFSDATLDVSKAITDINGRQYIEIAYVYEVEDDVAQFFTSEEDALQDEYYWSNAYFQWDQIYRGTNVRVVTYEDVFDHYEYNADGHIVNEVYKKVEKVEYKSGEEISTPAYGWLNSHDGSNRAYADERSQSDGNNQKWSFVGDPYDFELTNYAQYLLNSHSTMTSDGTAADDLNASNTETSHWAIVQGLQKTEVVNGKTVKVTDENGDPVYVYYLALIDDETGLATAFVTFDRAADNKDLSADEQFLYLKGGMLEDDSTGNLYSGTTSSIRPFYMADLISYANWVVYHLVIAHQHSLDYVDAFEEMATTAHKNAAKERIDKHLLEFLKYKYPAIMNSEKTDLKNEYLTSATLNAAGDTIKTGGVYDAIKDRLTSAATNDETLAQLLKNASLRDVVNDSISDYSVQRVGIGNTLTVPWYMKRQFCNYDLYQRDVLRSQISDRIVYEDDGVTPKTFIDENGVEQIAKEVDWVSVTGFPEADGYDKVVLENGTRITKLNDSHRNRMVIVDVVYTVDEDEFRFADKGRNTTAWYSMLTNNDKDGLMNFSYKDGVGARHGRETHYTNNYLWAPEGDPYGFVMHSRYATINGTGWDNVVITSPGMLPTKTTDTKDKIGSIDYTTAYSPGETLTYVDIDQATYTGHSGNVPFNVKRVTHPGRGYDGRRTWGARNAVYEMFAGNYEHSFLMHPTSAYIGIDADKFSSFYMLHNVADHKAELKYYADVKSIRSDKDANWRLMTTPEQLLPYFERSGYVGGLEPEIANRFENQALYTTLQYYKENYRATPSVIDFKTVDKARVLVYGGKFYRRGGTGNPYTTEILFSEARPTTNDDLPLKFVSNNLVPLTQGYYRIQAFSRAALDKDGEDLDGTGITGIQGPRYISGYRFQSEKDYEGYSSENTLTPGSRWLHFIETDEEHTTIKTFEELNAKIRSLDNSSHVERDIEPHPAMRGNIEILPAEYDPASIFYFTPADMSGGDADSYDRWNIGTQGLRLRGRAGGKQGTDTNYGITKLVDPLATGYTPGPGKLGTDFQEPSDDGYENFDDRFRINDIGGTAVTMRLRKYVIGDVVNGQTSTTWDDIVGENLKTNYLTIDANHRYRITIHKDNEMKEIGDGYVEGEDYWQLSDINYGIQDTKWLLQPVGVQTEWPYNQMPLSVRVNEGGQKPNTSDGTGLSGTENKDNNYYASLYVPFDTRLAKTVDAAFTNTNETPAPKSITLKSVSQLNNMGNPQFIPARWPVVLRTSQPVTTITKEDGTTMASAPHVNLYLPNNAPTSIPESFAKIHLYGELLEDSLTAAEIEARTGVEDGRQKVMVVGLPFVATGTNTTYGNKASHYSEEYYGYDIGSAVGFYTNENWNRGHFNPDGSNNGVTSAAAFTELSVAEQSKLAQAQWVTARTATSQQRANTYLYHNKAYYVYDTGASPVKGDYFYFLFDEDGIEQPEEDEGDWETPATGTVTGVYDLSGRLLRTREAVLNGTWRRNLPPGMYIVNGRKMTVK